MIDLENFNNQTFEEILDLAKKKISQLSGDWNNTQESDPGITLVELFAWLKVKQHESINTVLEDTKYKFLNLLDIKKEHNRGSSTLVNLSDVKKDITVPAGTKFRAGSLVFENEVHQELCSAKISNIAFSCLESDKGIEYNHFDGKRIFSLFGDKIDDGKKNYFTINFDSPLPKDMSVSLHFDMFMEDGYSRNPVSDSDDFVDMAEVSWEFYGNKDGITDWHSVDVVSDKTRRFLFSGVVSLSVNGTMEPFDGFYPIRVTLLNQTYDFTPRVTGIKVNVFELSQKDTLCESVIVGMQDILDKNRIEISTNLSLYGNNQIYLKDGDSWVEEKDFTVRKNVLKGTTSFMIKNLRQKLESANDEDAVMIVSYDESIENKIIIGNGTGISDQVLHIIGDRVSYDDFNLMVGYRKDNKVLFDKWDKVEDFFSSGKYDKHYVLDSEENYIKFGSHERGQAPMKLADSIRLISFAKTEGSGGNVKKGIINEVDTQNTALKDLSIDQITSAVDGRDTETFEDVKAKAADVLNQSGRAITVSDYEEIVKATPGLVIQNVKVIPSCISDNKDNVNCVTVIIGGKSKDQKLPHGVYGKNIKNHLDKFRLINTKIEIRPPVYIGLSITGDVVVNSYYKNSVFEINKKINEFVQNLNKTWGQNLYFGDMFGMIDGLDCVSYVDKLHINPTGDYIEKTMTDDILVPPNGAYYIKSIDLNYIKSANI